MMTIYEVPANHVAMVQSSAKGVFADLIEFVRRTAKRFFGFLRRLVERIVRLISDAFDLAIRFVKDLLNMVF